MPKDKMKTRAIKMKDSVVEGIRSAIFEAERELATNEEKHAHVKAAALRLLELHDIPWLPNYIERVIEEYAVDLMVGLAVGLLKDDLKQRELL